MADVGASLRILTLALASGVAVFAAIALAVGPVADTPPETAMLYFGIAAAASATTAAGAVLVQKHLRDRLAMAEPGTDPDALIRTMHVVSMAMAEGGALLAVVFALLTGQWIFVGLVLPFFAIAAMFFPSESRLAGLRAMAEAR